MTILATSAVRFLLQAVASRDTVILPRSLVSMADFGNRGDNFNDLPGRVRRPLDDANDDDGDSPYDDSRERGQ